MDSRPAAPSIPPDALLAHAEFVRRLAFALLRDDSDADDASQDALARGLSAGSREPGAQRARLATVVRNLARTLRRAMPLLRGCRDLDDALLQRVLHREPQLAGRSEGLSDRVGVEDWLLVHLDHDVELPEPRHGRPPASLHLGDDDPGRPLCHVEVAAHLVRESPKRRSELL